MCAMHPARIPFRLIRLIDSSGAQGEVFLAERTDGITPREIAVKKAHLDLNAEAAREQIQLLDRDLMSILHLNHPHLVRHLDHHNAAETTTVTVPAYHIVMEYCAGGTLHAAAKFQIPAATLQKWTRQIVDGVNYLHDNQIVHRDLKGVNILLTSTDWSTCVMKIADLGAIKRLLSNATQPKEVSHGKGTWAFMSPEMIMGDHSPFNIGRKTDIWSLGCVVLEMVSGFPRFVKVVDGKQVDLKTDLAAMYYIGNGGSPIVPDGIPEGLRSFVMECLRREPTARPVANELPLRPFLNMRSVPQWSDPRPRRTQT